ncbi:hypothetical protein [Microbacterium sp. GCS4]|uniref:hypothetical protein n=1 Tax=Microbacterium sp. GCS4 TaxID=1692239 RepID=UPI00128FA503|nr:hypothetical protein [Microbacterium sp. GCS4]
MNISSAIPSASSTIICGDTKTDLGEIASGCWTVVLQEVSAGANGVDFGLLAAVAAGLGAIAAAAVATINLRIDYVARRDQRVAALVAHFMSEEVAAARDLLTAKESKFHGSRTRHSAFLLLWTIERVGADLDALRPSWASKVAYSHGRRPRQASGIEVLYANIARVTRCLNRYFRSDASNSYFSGSVGTANRVLGDLPDWHSISHDQFKTRVVEPREGEDYRERHVYKIIPPINEFRPPRGTGSTNRLQRLRRDARSRRA